MAVKAIRRGSEMKMSFRLPQKFASPKKFEAILSQRDVTLIKECEYDSSEGICTARLSQRETLRFADGDVINIQIKVLLESGDVLLSELICVECTKGLSSEVIA